MYCAFYWTCLLHSITQSCFYNLASKVPEKGCVPIQVVTVNIQVCCVLSVSCRSSANWWETERTSSEPRGDLCKRIERPVKQNKILVVTMATFMDKEEHEARSSLLLLYLNIYWLAALVESWIINFFPSGGINKWRWGLPKGKPVLCKEFLMKSGLSDDRGMLGCLCWAGKSVVKLRDCVIEGTVVTLLLKIADR